MKASAVVVIVVNDKKKTVLTRAQMGKLGPGGPGRPKTKIQSSLKVPQVGTLHIKIERSQ